MLTNRRYFPHTAAVLSGIVTGTLGVGLATGATDTPTQPVSPTQPATTPVQAPANTTPASPGSTKETPLLAAEIKARLPAIVRQAGGGTDADSIVAWPARRATLRTQIDSTQAQVTPEDDDQVIAVAAHGHFTAANVPHPPGAVTTGSWLVLSVDPATGNVVEYALMDQDPRTRLAGYEAGARIPLPAVG